MAGERRKYTMIPPQVLREGTKKTVFVNLSDMCKRMRRQPEHVMQFLFAELGTSGSVDGGGRLIIKGTQRGENPREGSWGRCGLCIRPGPMNAMGFPALPSFLPASSPSQLFFGYLLVSSPFVSDVVFATTPL